MKARGVARASTTTPLTSYGCRAPRCARGVAAAYDAPASLYASDLAARWTMNQGNGYLTDASGKGHRGTAANAPLRSDDSRAGKAVAFDGVNDYVHVDDAADLRMGTNSFTVALWLKQGANDADPEYLVVKGRVPPAAAGDSGWAVKSTSSNWVAITLSNAGGYQHFYAFTVTQDVWSHVAFVVDRSAGAITAYKDGVSQGSTAITVTGDIGHTNPLLIGGWNSPGATSFKGALDEVKLYSRALTATEVAATRDENDARYGEYLGYSTIGNIADKSDQAYNYGAKPHAVTAVGPNSYTYDSNGNMTVRGSQTVTWDTENRVSQVTWGSNTTTMTYDGDGRRVKKVEAGVTTVYPNGFYEKNVTASEVTTYYHLGGQLVALRKGSTLEDVHQDHLGGTVASTTSAGASQSTTSYLPFGGARASSGTLGTDKKYTGQRLDGTGLYDYGARYYDPALGRFVSADSIVPSMTNPQALNRYSYVLNNPLRYTDPDGHCGCDPDEDVNMVAFSAFMAGGSAAVAPAVAAFVAANPPLVPSAPTPAAAPAASLPPAAPGVPPAPSTPPAFGPPPPAAQAPPPSAAGSLPAQTPVTPGGSPPPGGPPPAAAPTAQPETEQTDVDAALDTFRTGFVLAATGFGAAALFGLGGPAVATAAVAFAAVGTGIVIAQVITGRATPDEPIRSVLKDVSYFVPGRGLVSDLAKEFWKAAVDNYGRRH